MEKANRGWRWSNLPLPESHLLLMTLATVLGFLVPKRMRGGMLFRISGWFLVAAGAALAVAATRTAGKVDLVRPQKLITRGPYARSRHPMYAAWTMIYLGIALVTGNLWLVFLFPILAGLVHREVLREERNLRNAFGAEYDEYRSQVRRYF